MGSLGGEESSVPVRGVSGRVIVAQLLDNVGQLSVLPADQDVAAAGVVFDQFLDTLGVGLGAGSVDSQSQLLGEGEDRLIGAIPLAIYMLRSMSDRAKAQWLLATYLTWVVRR